VDGVGIAPFACINKNDLIHYSLSLHMISLLLILIPLAGGLFNFFLRSDQAVRFWTLLVSFSSLATVLCHLFCGETANASFQADWLSLIGASFALQMDGAAALMSLLSAVVYVLITLAIWKNDIRSSNNFFALLLLTQAGVNGVFLASDGLLFYFFWELALIPVYFLCSIWGGEKRIAVTFKFFVYTFLGSLLMLAGLLYMAYQAGGSFSLQALSEVKLSSAQQSWLFWLFFVAFAVKMPIFPFHTWQPDAYEQSPTAVTMVLSALMVKMGLFAVIRWLFPLLPGGVLQYSTIVIWLSIAGMLYASFIAMKQDDLKRLIAYSSIAHIGLINAALFAGNEGGYNGTMIQMFSHGVNVLGMWIVADIIEQKTGTRKISELGGLAQSSPALAILLLIVALANIALPLTNAFIGEFLMFNALFKAGVWYAVAAGFSIIFGAVYTLRMIQHIFLGEKTERADAVSSLPIGATLSLVLISVLIFVGGLYPGLFFRLTEDSVTVLLKIFN
jgi:NADH-quinone oxidoreductase subunit M